MQSTVDFTIPNAEFLVTVHGSLQATACSPRLEQVQRASWDHQLRSNNSSRPSNWLYRGFLTLIQWPEASPSPCTVNPSSCRQ
jgi:hypothetical protein